MQEKTADSERRRDVKPGLHFARADRLRVKANWLVVTLVFLGLSLWMFTCAQIIQRGLRYVFALGGMFFFAGSVMAAFLIELFL
jgi:hypothetical protein